MQTDAFSRHPAEAEVLRGRPAASTMGDENSIILIGTSFRNSPIGFRENLLAFTRRTTLSPTSLHFLESVHLQTCNRIEFYFVTKEPEITKKRFFSSLPAQIAADPRRFYVLSGADTIQHLFELASGLDSMVVGEDQILFQIRDVSKSARRTGTSRAVLSTLFDAAMGVGRRVRTSGAVPPDGRSVSSLALKMARRALGRPPRRVLLIGTGKVAKLAASQLRGCEVLVATRSKQVPPSLRSARLVSHKDVGAVARQCDLIISATTSGSYIIKAAQLPDDAERVILDLGFPRNVDPGLRNSKCNKLLDLDDLAARVHQEEDATFFTGPAKLMIDDEVATFRRWLIASRLSSSLPSLYRWAETVRHSETQRAMRRLPGLSAQEKRIVETMASRLVSKLLAPAARFSKASTERLSQSERLEILDAIFGEVESDRES